MRAHSTIIAMACSAMLMMGVSGTAPAADARGGDPSLNAKVQRLLDREAILELLVTYGRLLDKRDLVGYSKLFAADGVWEGGIGSAKGPAAIQQMLERVYGRVEPGRFGSGAYHIMSDFIVAIDGKPAIQRSGHYEDKLVRERGEWRFKHRLTVTEMPTPQKDTEAQIFRRDHREKD
jgi:hypothetical protein